MQIEKVKNEDIPQLKALAKMSLMREVDASEHEKAFLLPHILNDIDTYFSDERSIFLKAETMRLLGYILIKEDPSIKGSRHLIHLFTDPEHKKKGVGKLLMLSALEHVKNDGGALQIVLNSSANAVGFYKKMGFSINDLCEPKSESSTPMIMYL